MEQVPGKRVFAEQANLLMIKSSFLDMQLVINGCDYLLIAASCKVNVIWIKIDN